MVQVSNNQNCHGKSAAGNRSQCRTRYPHRGKTQFPENENIIQYYIYQHSSDGSRHHDFSLANTCKITSQRIAEHAKYCSPG